MKIKRCYIMTRPETSIPLSRKTRDRLKKYGCVGETYDIVLTRLMDEHDECKSNNSGS